VNKVSNLLFHSTILKDTHLDFQPQGMLDLYTLPHTKYDTATSQLDRTPLLYSHTICEGLNEHLPDNAKEKVI